MFAFQLNKTNLLLRNSRNLLQKQQRYFDLHEFQSKEVMRGYGVNVQRGALAYNPEEAAKISEGLSNKGGLILKAQVHAGGRGKGHLTSGLQGGVKICKTPQEIADFTKQMIGYNLITHQTTKKGLPVKSVLVHEGVDIDRQIYLAFLLDRESGGPVVVASQKGGMDIEAVAEEDPEAILKFLVPLKEGMTDAIAKQIVDGLELEEGAQKEQGIEQLKKLYKLFLETDSTQVEINPWAVTPEGDLYCVDAKINIDDNALFRHKDIVEMKEKTASSEEVDPNEAKAQKLGLNYIGLEGNIGCMVNGAGLAMATMDIIKLKGEEPANFLDIGGSANSDQVSAAFQILSDHPSVEAILINIFGGIVKCDLIAQEVIKATQKVDVKVPIVMRLTGTNSDRGK